jgi:microcystin-dependent protein
MFSSRSDTGTALAALTLGSLIVVSAMMSGRAQDAGSVLPPGTLIAYGGRGTPGGFLPADGKTLPASDPTYAALCAALGDRFNASGDPVGTCRLPNLTDRVPVGAGRRPIGSMYGEESLKLPQHDHPLNFGVFSFRGSAGALMQTEDNAIVAGFPYVRNHHPNDPMVEVKNGRAQRLTVGHAGEPDASNAQPSLVVRYLIKI